MNGLPPKVAALMLLSRCHVAHEEYADAEKCCERILAVPLRAGTIWKFFPALRLRFRFTELGTASWICFILLVPEARRQSSCVGGIDGSEASRAGGLAQGMTRTISGAAAARRSAVPPHDAWNPQQIFRTE